MLEFLFSEVAGSGLRVCKFIKKRLQHRCFPVNIAKCLRTPLLQNTSGWLFLMCAVITAESLIGMGDNLSFYSYSN